MSWLNTKQFFGQQTDFLGAFVPSLMLCNMQKKINLSFQKVLLASKQFRNFTNTFPVNNFQKFFETFWKFLTSFGKFLKVFYVIFYFLNI